jgi:hypothetical protein
LIIKLETLGMLERSGISKDPLKYIRHADPAGLGVAEAGIQGRVVGKANGHGSADQRGS